MFDFIYNKKAIICYIMELPRMNGFYVIYKKFVN